MLHGIHDPIIEQRTIEETKMRAIRNLIDKIVNREFVPMDLLHPGDVTAGRVTVCDDEEGDPIVIDEISLRAVLHRMDPVDLDKVDSTTIRVSAWYMASAIDDRYQPIHVAIPNRIAAAPMRDRKELRRLRDAGYSVAARGSHATMLLNVPESVAGWTGIRCRKHDAALHRAFG